MKLLLSGVIDKINTTADGTIKVTFGTNEMEANQAGQLFSLRNKFCKILLSDTNITAIEEKLIDEETIKDGKRIKSKSQRLRGVLFKLFELENTTQSFDSWYDNKMEAIIDFYKSKLD